MSQAATTPASNRISLLLQVRPGEGRLVLLLVGYSLFVSLAFAFTQAAAMGLFLGAYGPQDLPQVYMATAGAAFVVGYAYLRLAQRVPLGRLLVGNLTFLIAVSVAFRLGLIGTPPRWVLFALPIWFQVHINLGLLAIWSLPGRVFNVQQGKRLFGLVGSGYWLAFAVGGLLVPWLVAWFGTPNLFLLAAVVMAVALFILLVILRTHGREVSVPVRQGAGSHVGPTRRVRSQYVDLILAWYFLLWIAFFFLDNIYFYRATVQYPDPGSLAGFVGVVGAAEGVIGLVATTFLVSPILGRFGLRAGLLIMPVPVAAAIAALAVGGTLQAAAALLFVLATGAKLLNVSLSFSIQQSALSVLYQPLPPQERVEAHALAEGVLQPLAIGLAGLLLLVLHRLLGGGSVVLSYLFLLLTAGVIALALALVRAYPAALTQALGRRRALGPAGVPVTRESLAILRRELNNTHPDVALYALRQILTLDQAEGEQSLCRLLTHPSLSVRLEVLQRIEQEAVSGCSEAVRRTFETDPSSAARGAAARSLLALRAVSPHEMLDLTESADTEIRIPVLIALARYAGDDMGARAFQLIAHLCVDDDAGVRRGAARALSEMDHLPISNLLRPLLSDRLPAVRSEALRAAGRSGDTRLWPLVIEALGDSHTRLAAAAALVAGGEHALPAIAAALQDGGDLVPARRLVRVCSRMRSPHCIPLLLDHVDAPDPVLQSEVLVAVSECGFQASGVMAPDIRGRIEAELSRASALLRAQASFGDTPPERLLAAAIEREVVHAAERTLLLLSFLPGMRSILHARDALRTDADSMRAYGLELVETLAPPDLRGRVLALVDDRPYAERLRHLDGSAPNRILSSAACLGPLITDTNLSAWTRACALYVAGRQRTDGLLLEVLEASRSRTSLVRESARQALSSLPDHHEDDTVVSDGSGSARTLRVAGPPPATMRRAMLSTVEKVIILRTVDVFADTPDDLLADLAAVTDELEFAADEQIAVKDDIGDSLYVIVSGRVRAHDGEHTFAEMGPREVFGEMAVLDSQPRSASLTALDETVVLRLKQDALFEVMADSPDILRGLLRVLVRRMRESSAEVVRLAAQLAAAEGGSGS